MNSDLSTTLKDALQDNTVRTAAVYDPEGSGRAVFLIEPLDQHGFSENPSEIAYLIKSCHAEWNPQAARLLRQTFGLIETEIRVVELLYQGFRSIDIAQRRGRTKGTVRKQIKSILH